MKRTINLLTCCLLAISLFFPSFNILAEESSQENELIHSDSIQPRWWPGNPNPTPGTEDWFFQNQSYGSSASIEFSSACAWKVLKDVGIPGGTAEAINVFLLNSIFSVGTFGVAFGVGYIYGYGTCLWDKGVRW